MYGEQLENAEDQQGAQPVSKSETKAEPPAGPPDRPPVLVSDKTNTPAESRVAMREADERLAAEAEFAGAPGVTVSGEVELEEIAGGLEIEVEARGLSPGPHGIHVHERGDCSDIRGESMGGHFAPSGNQHGLPDAKQHHLGDLGNIVFDESGTAKLEVKVPAANLKQEDPRSFLGKSVVIHEQKDTGHGKSGQAGPPLACAVIRRD